MRDERIDRMEVGGGAREDVLTVLYSTVHMREEGLGRRRMGEGRG